MNTFEFDTVIIATASSGIFSLFEINLNVDKSFIVFPANILPVKIAQFEVNKTIPSNPLLSELYDKLL